MKRETVLKALRILATYSRPCTPREFAMSMWPASKGWDKPALVSRDGITHGACMHSAGACFLGRLMARYLVLRVGAGYELTDSGRDYLAREGLPPPEPTPPPAPIQWDGHQWVYWDGRAWIRWTGRV